MTCPAQLRRRRLRRRGFPVCAAPVLAALCVVLAGCGWPRQTPRIALLTPLTTFDLWKGMHAGVYRACAEAHLSLYWNGPTHEGDAERQVALLERQLRLHVAGVVLAPNQASALIPAVAEAQREGIPVMLAGDQLAMPLGRGVGSVASDDRRAGELAAGVVAGLLHGHGEAVIAGVDPASSANLARVRSFEMTMAARYPGIQIVGKGYQLPRPMGDSNLDLPHMLRRYPGVQAIFSPALAGTRSAYGTLQEAGALGRVQLVVCDQDAEEFEPLRRGEIAAVVAENVYAIGYQAARALIEHRITGAALPSSVVEPLLLTRENVMQPAIQHLLRPYSGYDR